MPVPGAGAQADLQDVLKELVHVYGAEFVVAPCREFCSEVGHQIATDGIGNELACCQRVDGYGPVIWVIVRVDGGDQRVLLIGPVLECRPDGDGIQHAVHTLIVLSILGRRRVPVVRHDVVHAEPLVFEHARRHHGHDVHGVDNVVDVLVVQCVLAGGSALRTLPGVAVDIVLRRIEVRSFVRQVAGSQVRDRGGAGKAGDPVFYIARDALLLQVGFYTIADLPGASVETLVPHIGSSVPGRADLHIARPLGAIARSADADGDEREVLVLLRDFVVDVDLFACNDIGDAVPFRSVVIVVVFEVRKSAGGQELPRVCGAVGVVGVVPGAGTGRDDIACGSGIGCDRKVHGTGGKRHIVQSRPGHFLRRGGVVDG